MTPDEIKTKLKATLKESRYLHSLSVAKTAESLAQKYGADPQKAYLAGLVHDCAKCFTVKELLDKMDGYNIKLDSDALTSPPLWHSFVGAYEAKEVYGIEDEEIFDAIYYHTLGKEKMSLLTAIIYLADAIEPMRNYPGVDHIRREAEKSLEKAIYLYTKGTIDYVKERGLNLHSKALIVRDYYSQF